MVISPYYRVALYGCKNRLRLPSLLVVDLYFITARMLHELAAMKRKSFRIASESFLSRVQICGRDDKNASGKV
jgi:hypothetical protein